jgi:hypothetical protein
LRAEQLNSIAYSKKETISFISWSFLLSTNVLWKIFSFSTVCINDLNKLNLAWWFGLSLRIFLAKNALKMWPISNVVKSEPGNNDLGSFTTKVKSKLLLHSVPNYCLYTKLNYGWRLICFNSLQSPTYFLWVATVRPLDHS